MLKLPLLACLSTWTLAAAVLPGAMAGTLTATSGYTPAAEDVVTSYDTGSGSIDKGTILTTPASAATLSVVNGGTLSVANGATYTLFTGLTSETGGFANLTGGTNTVTIRAVKYPDLSGTAGDLKITSLDDGNTLRIKTTVSVTNSGTGAAKNVTATVYLSDDAVLDAAKDTKLKTLKLSDYLSGVTKLLKGQTLILPIKHKFPTAIASFLEGKYLIAVLGSDNALNLGALNISLNISNGVGVISNGATFTFVNGNYNIAFPATTATVTTPKNQVIIGPIHLPTSD